MFKSIRIFLIVTGLVFVVALSGCMDTSNNNTNGDVTDGPYVFGNPKKSAHYEANTPNHGAILAGVPINIVIDFNFDLGAGSEIRITNNDNDNEYGVGSTTIDGNKLAMRRDMDPSAPDGVYSVNYTACWPDGSCHQGFFQFAINRSKATGFVDRRGENRVEITMKNIAFHPKDILISIGTEVVWINEDPAIHYINSDSHPHHTYFPSQNSEAMMKGDTFSLVFDKPGIYPYHCSAHTGMTGQILVQ